MPPQSRPPEINFGSVVVLVPLGLVALSFLPGWFIMMFLLGGFLLGASKMASFVEKAEADQRRQQAASGVPAAPPGEVIELRSSGGLRLTAMRAQWGTWPTEASEALSGHVCALPPRALADPSNPARQAARGRVVVLRREEIRAMGVRSWLSVARAVQATGASALLVVNVSDDLAPLQLSERGPGAAQILPTALLKNSEGEALLKEVAHGSGDSVTLSGPGPTEKALARAEELSAAERHTEAAEAIASAIDHAVGSEAIRLHIRHAESLRLAGRPVEAVAAAKQAVGLDPESAVGWLEVVQAHRASGDCDEARKAAEQATDLYEIQDERLTALVAELSCSPQELAEAHKDTGNTLFREHRFADARSAYTKALQVLPVGAAEELRAVCLGNRAACAQQLHEWDAVISDATQALALKPDNIKVRLRRATAREAVERFQGALEDAREILRVDPRNQKANAIQHSAGRAVRDLGLDLRESAAAMGTCTHSSPPLAEVHAPSPPLPEEVRAPSPLPPKLAPHVAPCIDPLRAEDCSFQFGKEPAGSTGKGNASDHTRTPDCAPNQAPNAVQAEQTLPSIQKNSRIQELEAALVAAADMHRSLEQRCGGLERALSAASTENAELRVLVSQSAAISPDLQQSPCTSPTSNREASVAARRGRQLERVMAIVHDSAVKRAREEEAKVSEGLASDGSEQGGQARRGAVGSNCASSAGSLPANDEDYSMRQGKHEHEQQHLRKTVDTFYNRFRVRCN